MEQQPAGESERLRDHIDATFKAMQALDVKLPPAKNQHGPEVRVEAGGASYTVRLPGNVVWTVCLMSDGRVQEAVEEGERGTLESRLTMYEPRLPVPGERALMRALGLRPPLPI